MLVMKTNILKIHATGIATFKKCFTWLIKMNIFEFQIPATKSDMPDGIAIC